MTYSLLNLYRASFFSIPIQVLQEAMYVPFLLIENIQDVADGFCFRGHLRCRAIDSSKLCERCVIFFVCLLVYVFFFP